MMDASLPQAEEGTGGSVGLLFRSAPVPGLNSTRPRVSSCQLSIIYHAIQTDMYRYAACETIARICDRGWRWNAGQCWGRLRQSE